MTQAKSTKKGDRWERDEQYPGHRQPGSPIGQPRIEPQQPDESEYQPTEGGESVKEPHGASLRGHGRECIKRVNSYGDEQQSAGGEEHWHTPMFERFPE